MATTTGSSAQTLLKKGDTRADGFRFWGYEKRRGKFYERWRSPASFERCKRGADPKAPPKYARCLIGPKCPVAWAVVTPITDEPSITFAFTKSVAKWNAMRSMREAGYYDRAKEWPSFIRAVRAPDYDYAFWKLPQRAGRACFSEDYIREMI